jgi:hypothetical protein
MHKVAAWMLYMFGTTNFNTMKMAFLIVALAALGLVGLVLLFRIGVNTFETTLAEYKEGKDHVVLRYAYTTNWGNSLVSRQLIWNNKLVDFQGLVMGREHEGNKQFPVHAADIATLKVDLLSVPDSSAIPWTIWVNPKDFSAQAYERLKELLLKSQESLLEQQQNYQVPKTTAPADTFFYQHVGRPLKIWRMVYFNYAKLKPREFLREKGKIKETITVGVGGEVSILKRTDQYGLFGASMGQLNATGDTLTLLEHWNSSDLFFPPAELSEFRDVEGLSFASYYKVIQNQ